MGLENSSQINDYVDNVCSYVRYNEAHKEIKLELYSHIEDIIDEYTEEGLSQDEALDKAVKRMGDAETVGKQLNTAHKGTPDWVTLILAIVLTNIGVVLMYFMNYKGLEESYKYRFNHSLIYSAVGTAIIITLYFLDYRKLEKYSKYIFWGMCALYIVFFNIGRPVNGIPMLRLKNFSFDFTAVSPYIFIIALAGILNNWNWNKRVNLVKVLPLLILPMILMIYGGSAASCGIYFIAFLVLGLKAGMKKRYAFCIFASNMMLFWFYLLARPYRICRLLSFLDPFADPQGMGYVNATIYKIIRKAGMFGQGFSFDKTILLPEMHSEFILNFVIYTFGWFGAAVIIALAICFVLRILHITRRIRDTYGKLLINGLVSIFIVQFVTNILMNLNLFPIIGITFPLLSYGGSLGLFNMISIGIILSVYRRRSLSLNQEVGVKG